MPAQAHIAEFGRVLAISQEVPARAAPPRVQPEPPPRPRSRDPRDRAFMDGGMPTTPGFSGFGGLAGAAPLPSGALAPRPNLDLELRTTPQPQSATISPTMIHPRLPGRGAATDGAVSQQEQRLLQGPAPGARLSVPLTW